MPFYPMMDLLRPDLLYAPVPLFADYPAPMLTRRTLGLRGAELLARRRSAPRTIAMSGLRPRP